MKKSKIEYLSIPYSDDDPFVKQFRTEISDLIFSDLTKHGRILFAPISSCHHVAVKYGMPTHFAFWHAFNEEFISNSGKLLVVTLPNWEKSIGVVAEVAMAKKYKIPVEYVDPQPYIERLKGVIKEIQH